MGKGKKRIGLWVTAAVIALIVAAQLVLGPGICTPVVNRLVSEYIDGDFSTGRVYVSLLRHFPAVTANIEDFVISYPSSRFTKDSLDHRTDTLASFRKFSVAVNVLSLLKGQINVKNIELSRPRAVLRFFEDGSSNLQILRLGSSGKEEESDVPAALPDINLRRLHLSDSAFVAYISPLDTALAGIEKLDLRGRRGRMKLRAQACLYAGTDRWGRLRIPIGMDGRIYAVKEGEEQIWNLGCRDLEISVAGIAAKVNLRSSVADSINLKGSAEIADFYVQEFIDSYAVKFYPEIGRLHTDARLGAVVNVDGFYNPDTAELPAFNARVNLDRCTVGYDGIGLHPTLKMCVEASAGQGGPISVNLNGLSFKAPGLNLNVDGRLSDLLGKDPSVDASATLNANLSKLDTLLAEGLQMNLKGNMDAKAEGRVNLRTFNLYNPASFDLRSSINLNDVCIRSFDDSLKAYIDSLDLKVALLDDRFGLSPDKKEKALGAICNVDSLYLCREGYMKVTGRNLKLLAQSSPAHIDLPDGKRYNPIHALMSVGDFSFRGKDSVSVYLRNSRNSLKFSPYRKQTSIPEFSVTSSNGFLGAKSGVHRIFLRDLGFFANARMNPVRKDTLSTAKKMRRPGYSPDALRDSRAFIRFDIGEDLKKYLNAWDIKGTVKLNRAAIATPAFPMRTAVAGFKGRFSNDAVELDTLRIYTGSSNLSARGRIGNLRRVLTRGGMIKMDMEVDTDSLSLTELLNAYALGQKNMGKDLSYLDNVDDSQYENVTDELASADTLTPVKTYIPVPVNVDAKLIVRGKGISYSSMDISDFSADVLMKRRCLQLSGVKAITSVGNLSAEAFYSTVSRRDITAGFNVDINSISAADVIALMPQIDTLMPLLKSFGGKLDCSLAATAQLDTCMNILTPTMDGVIRIKGNDLHFQDNEQIAKIGRKLLFKQPERATIDSMTVEGIIHDNSLEIFPFFLKMDRWTLALAGIQNMDKSFNYHVSMVKTPAILHLGANIYGPDFDHVKFKIGKAKYNSSNGIPSFSQVIDVTRINLVSSIRSVFDRGVKQAVDDSRGRRNFIQQQREKAGYTVSAALENLEELSEDEKRQSDTQTDE